MDNPSPIESHEQIPPAEAIDNQRAKGAAIVFSLVALISFVFAIFLIGRNHIWQVYTITAITAVALVMDVWGTLLIWRGRSAVGLQILFWSLMVTVPPNVLLVTSTTPYLIGIVLFVGFVHVFYLHPRSWRRLYPFSPIVASILMALVEISHPAFRADLIKTNTSSNYFGPVMLGFLVVAVIFLVLRQRDFLAEILGNISVAWKIVLTVAVLFLGMLGISVSAYVGAGSLSYQLDNMYNFMLIPITAINQADTSLTQSQFAIAQLLRSDLTADQRTTNLQEIQANTNAAETTFSRYDTDWVTTSSPVFTQALKNAGKIDLQRQETASLAALHAAMKDYEAALASFQQSVQTGRPDVDLADAAILRLEVVHTQLHRLIDINNQFADFSNTAAQAAYRQALLTGGIVLGISLTFGLLISFLVVLSITSRLSVLTRGATSIESGDLDQVISMTGRDEVAVLGHAFNKMAAQLSELIGTLEQRVASRTKDLATVAEVSTATATLQRTDQLLQEVVDLTKERFNLYHSHIYLLDETGENLVLAAGAGEPGRRMTAQGHSIPLSRPQSLVARAARERHGVTVNDVTQAPDFLPNPLLPDTRSELAAPMLVGGRVIGVFDIQSDQIGRFTETDISIQTTLAAQVATSVQNVRSFEQARRQADFESLVNAIGQKIQRAATVEETLQTAVREIGLALNAQRVKLDIAARPETAGSSLDQ